jgi:hypothetical protein
MEQRRARLREEARLKQRALAKQQVFFYIS